MTTTNNLTNTTYLILGGARSGKSSYAEKIAIETAATTGKEVIYLATAKILDDEIEQRVAKHKTDRPNHWKTVEEPIALASALEKYCSCDSIVLVDCLTMWVNNLLMLEDDTLFNAEIEKLHQVLPRLSGGLILVSNEVGMGIVPMGELSRKFVDETGRLHQSLGQVLDNVLMIVAGIAVEVKGKKPF